MKDFFATDTELCITSWGEEISRLTGRKAAEVQGEKYFEVLPRIFSGGEDALSLVLKGNKPLSLKAYGLRCLVDRMSADIRISPVRAGGGLKGVKVMLSDILPCSIACSFQNSQRLIDIGKTASTLAHGVRNPLNAIKGAVVYLSEKYAAEPALVEFAQIMEEEISRLDNFISRFLSTSISDAVFALTDINALIRRLASFTALQAHVHNIKSVHEFGEIPLIRVNAFQLEQAVLSVLNNAIDAMPSGGMLTIRTAYEPHSEDFVTIEISDTGPGISGGALATPCVAANEKGKGFGLFIAREVLQYHGGRLEIQCEKGKGTSVKLCLPMERNCPICLER